MGALSIRNIRKSYAATDVLKGINIDIEAGEFLILVGPSGCGKSTLLSLIAGLDSITSGEIYIGGKLVNNLSPKDRDIAMVFQSYALYPTMSVRQNIAFGLEMRKVAKAQRDSTVARVAQILQIEPLLERKPAQLSGGQRQRVAMGRAIARDPTLFLFDEPLSNLDAKLRVEMRTEIKLLHQRLRTTIVYVTHDQIEAMTLGDKIAVMKAGEVMQFGTPQEIYDQPVNMFVAGFMGSPPMNFLSCKVVEQDGLCGLDIESQGQHHTLNLPNTGDKLKPWLGRAITLGLRPEKISHPAEIHQTTTAMIEINAKVEIVEPTGPDTLVVVKLNGKETVCRVHPEYAKPPGEMIELGIDLSHCVAFDPVSEQRVV
jgi:multiple sugar transport system ATP-binding protein